MTNKNGVVKIVSNLTITFILMICVDITLNSQTLSSVNSNKHKQVQQKAKRKAAAMELLAKLDNLPLSDEYRGARHSYYRMLFLKCELIDYLSIIKKYYNNENILNKCLILSYINQKLKKDSANTDFKECIQFYLQQGRSNILIANILPKIMDVLDATYYRKLDAFDMYAELLMRYFQSEYIDGETSYEIALRFGKYRIDKAMNLLISRIEKTSDPIEICGILLAIGQLGGKEHIKIIKDQIDNKDIVDTYLNHQLIRMSVSDHAKRSLDLLKRRLGNSNCYK